VLINSKRNLRKANRYTQLQSIILLRVVSLLLILYYMNTCADNHLAAVDGTRQHAHHNNLNRHQ
jgi:competence protein ComGC